MTTYEIRIGLLIAIMLFARVNVSFGLTITNILINDTSGFLVRVSEPMGVGAADETHNLVDIAGDPWVSSTSIFEDAGNSLIGFTDTLEIDWNIQHALGPHANDVNPNPTNSMLNLDFTPTATGTFSAVTAPLTVQHNVTTGSAHLDRFALRLSGTSAAGIVGGTFNITSYEIDYVATHDDTNGSNWPFAATPVAAQNYGNFPNNTPQLLHGGVDIPAPAETPIRAVLGGMITAVAPIVGGNCTGGCFFEVTDSNGDIHSYTHAKKLDGTDFTASDIGSPVLESEAIARVRAAADGNAGSFRHVHYDFIPFRLLAHFLTE